jgi:uncharacterized membrane protein required for colicin V production
MKNKPAHKKENFFGSKKMSLTLIFILEIMLVFTFLDYLAHSLSTAYAVPSSYFGSEVIYGTIFGFFVYCLVKNKKTFQKSLIFSAIISLGIQIIYLLLGYSLSFILTFLIINFVTIFVVSYLGFKIAKM